MQWTENDLSEMSDQELERLRLAIQQVEGRRQTLNAIPMQMESMTRQYLAASGIVEGDEWQQPTGPHNAYPEGWRVSHGGEQWVSEIPFNITRPGVAGWVQAAD